MDRHDWDERYRGSQLFWGADPNRFLVEEVRGLQAGRALDLGCGEGRNAVWLAEQGWDVLAVDFSVAALEKGRRLAAGRKAAVRWIAADVTGWLPPADAFDLVILLYLQLEPSARGRVLGRAAASVAPGGTLLVVAHDRRNLTEGIGGPRDPEVLYDPEEVAAELGVLRIERAERVRRSVPGDREDPVDAIDTLVRATRAPPGPDAH